MCVFKLSKGIGFRLPHNRVIDICLDFFLLVKHGRKRIFYHKCQESFNCKKLKKIDILSEMPGAFLLLQLSIGGSKQIIWFPSGGAIPQNESKLKVSQLVPSF